MLAIQSLLHVSRRAVLSALHANVFVSDGAALRALELLTY